MRNLCVNIFHGIDDETLYPLVKEAGFDGFFNPPEIAHDFPALLALKEYAEGLGLFQETVHSTIDHCSSVWWEGDAGDRYIEVLLNNIDSCAKLGVPILVVHPQSDFKPDPDIGLGLSRFEKAVNYAKEKNVKIAFENTDSEELLSAVLQRFDDWSHVGFCYDSGHECWLTPDARLLRKFGDRLFCTHLNDNDRKGDKHWLPGDGEADWEQICRDLRECGYQGNITMEVAFRERYQQVMDAREYVFKCYEILEKIAEKICRRDR